MSEKTALIVGGTSGIGLATARRLRERGATVHIAGRGKERLDGLAATDPGLIGHQADGGDRAAITALAERIGTIDWLVVTLSGSEGVGPIAELDLGMLRRAFDAKFWAHLTTIQAALPHLAPAGSITLVGAVTARAGMPGTAGIAALNGAVEALVKPLAVELAPIRVNGVSPGLVDTPWWSGMPEDARREYFAQAARALPARQVSTADDIAEVVVLAATNAGTTGTVIEADGGARLVSLG
ncbi:SDR family oxidoreductase [Amycolatopsis rhizosphaerae]|uniref:SDR family oxidoreductase n=1 Tax=Amycolatopsis rhizosphaerae TaxID=2053003 RepID=A0A558C0T1_9PSEU|nr:SDR family oxidoreductase [Amycolatopsis rhizosphaerae]TVT42400.1 SDR family oxidoreductase [Amycolatopsis rhizosphaerae]